jgi:hypothetical protein
MEKRKGFVRARFSKIWWAVLAMMLCAPVPSRALMYTDGEYHEVTESLYDYLWVSATGTTVDVSAFVQGGIYGGFLNVKGGLISGSGISVFAGSTVTVFGTDFALDDDPLGSATEFILHGSGHVLSGTYPNGHLMSLPLASAEPVVIYLENIGGGPIPVDIDIKPGSDPNPINPGSNGLIPVAIFTTDTFDAADVDPGSVTLAGAEVAVRGKSEKLMARLEDVDGDGDLDLLLQVDTQSDGAVWETGPVTLLGETYDGAAIEGTDNVVIVPPE